MKKILYFITVLTMAVFILTACRKNDATVYFASENTQADHDEDVSYQSTENSDTSVKESSSENEDQAAEVVVYVCGEVNDPGVYHLPNKSRVCDAIESAGGMTDDAGRDFWNLASEVYDGQMIYVPTKEEVESGSVPKPDTENAGVSSGDSSKININTASKEELMTLAGIGENKADNIIKYRQENGCFSAVEDLTNVSGIGESIFNKIKDSITV